MTLKQCQFIDYIVEHKSVVVLSVPRKTLEEDAVAAVFWGNYSRVGPYWEKRIKEEFETPVFTDEDTLYNWEKIVAGFYKEYEEYKKLKLNGKI